MRVYGTVNVLNFDSAGYTKAVRDAMETQFRKAARAFIRAASPLVPVQTGMAKGSFANVGRALGVAIPIAPRRTGLTYRAPGSSLTLPKTPESGASLSTPPEELFKWVNNRLTFTFQTKVFYYAIEDQYGLVSKQPWGSFAAGRAAFITEMRNLRGRLPSLGAYITKTSITFGNGRPSYGSPIRLRQQQTVR